MNTQTNEFGRGAEFNRRPYMMRQSYAFIGKTEFHNAIYCPARGNRVIFLRRNETIQIDLTDDTQETTITTMDNIKIHTVPKYYITHQRSFYPKKPWKKRTPKNMGVQNTRWLSSDEETIIYPDKRKSNGITKPTVAGTSDISSGDLPKSPQRYTSAFVNTAKRFDSKFTGPLFQKSIAKLNPSAPPFAVIKPQARENTEGEKNNETEN